MKSSILHRVIFSQATPLIRLGRRRALLADDAPPVPKDFDPTFTPAEFENIDTTKFWWFLVAMYRGTGAAGKRVLILSMVYLTCVLAGPMLLSSLLDLVAKNNTPLVVVYGIAVLLALSGLGGALAAQHFYFNALQGYAAMVNALNQRIVKQALLLRHSARSTMRTGDLVNHLSSDTDAIAESAIFVPEGLSSVVRTVVGAVLLWTFLGIATVPAFLVLILLTPVAIQVAKRYRRLDHQLMETRDERITLMSQILQGIRVVKFQAWEDSVHQQVAQVRRKEIDSRIRIVTTDAISTALFVSVTTLVAFVGFGAFVLMGGTLTAPIVFACLALFALLEEPFGMISHLLANIQHARVATSRLNAYLSASTRKKQNSETSAPCQPVGINASNATLRYAGAASTALSNVTLTIAPGTATAIVGSVGAGKSTLLRALASLHVLDSGSITYTNITKQQQPRTAYVPQEAFILNASVSDNITFGSEKTIEGGELDAIVTNCALDTDIGQLPAGIRTEIGERGVNLSGGQRHRVSLARAAWQQPGIVFLDDPLSAVDVHTEQHLVEQLLFGRWNAITRVVVTHRLAHLHRFDQVIVVDNGNVIACGAPHEIQGVIGTNGLLPRSTAATDRLVDSTNTPNIHEPVPHTVTASEYAETDERFTTDEDKESGAVRWHVYVSYVKALLGRTPLLRPLVAVAMIVSTATITVLPILQTWWLGQWTDTMNNNSVSAITAVTVFGALGLLVLAAWVIERLLWLWRAASAGMILHDQALLGVLHSRIRFFDTTPVGRVLNRFSRDQESVDDHLSWNIEQSVKSLAQTIGSLVLVVAVVPVLLFVIAPVLWLYYRIQRDYRTSAREAKRLESIARSPRYAHFKELVTGLDVIHAFGREQWFTNTFNQILTQYQRAFHCSILLNRWFSVRVAIISSVISLATSVSIVFLLQNDVMSVGIAGLVLTYALSFWGNLNWTVRAFSEVESRMTAVERLSSYGRLEPEPSVNDASFNNNTPPNEAREASSKLEQKESHIKTGAIEINNLSARYHTSLPIVLRNVTFSIPAHSTVGIIGRTGSGKSTLFQTLFRFIEPDSGSIIIDGVDYRTIPLRELRTSMAIIPQDPTLFLGTIRSNLDRYSQHSDAKVWEALRRVQLERFVYSLADTLNAPIIEGGLNLSQGQRQLLCMARAILSNAKIIVLDEATASVDHHTDALVQQTIRNEFQHATVLIIAHRLDTVADCDQIVELRNGVVHSITARS